MQNTKKWTAKMLAFCLSLAMVLSIFAVPALADTACKVTIQNKVGGDPEVYMDGSTLADGAEIAAGEHAFSVYTDYVTDELAEALVTITVDGVQAGEPQEIGYGGAEFEAVNVTGPVVIQIAAADDAPSDEPGEEPVEKKSYTIHYENKIESEDITMNVMTLDDEQKPAPIAEGSKIEEGKYVGVQVINSTDKKLLLTRLGADGSVAEKAYVDPAASAEDPGYGGIHCFDGVTEDTTFVLNYAPKTFKVTVNNGASSADIPDVAYNSIHVYDNSKGSSLDDIVGTAELDEGTPIEIYPYPLASAINLKVIHNGETIYDKNIHRIVPFVSDDKIEFINIDALQGDLEVITTAISSFEVNKIDNVKDSKINFLVATIDETGEQPKQVVLNDGDALFAGEMLTARVINDSEKKVKLTATRTSDGSVIEEVVVSPDDANGIYIMEMDAAVTFTLDEVKEETPEVKPETKQETKPVVTPTVKPATKTVEAPKAPTVKKVKAVKKGFQITWKKLPAKVKGVQIQYSLKKNFKSAKTVTIKKNKTTSKKISKLKAKKKYYVRMRCYQTVNGKKVYSAWSKVKTVKTKK